MKVYTVEENQVIDKGSKCAPHLTVRLLVTAILSVLGGGFHFGFQISIINPMADILQSFLMENVKSRYDVQLSESDFAFVWSSIAGSLFIGAALGAWLMSIVLESRGPKQGLLYSAMVLFLSIPLAGISHSLYSAELFVLSRLLSGVGVGMGTTAQGVFLAEISSVPFRGIVGSFGGFSTNIGFIIASTLGLPFVLGTKTAWPIIFYLEAIPCLILIIFNLSWFHESPLFLMRCGNDRIARTAIAAYSGSKCVNSEMDRVALEIKTQTTSTGIGHLISSRPIRKALLLSVTLNVTVSFSGILAVSFFGTFLLQSIGFSEFDASLANCFSGLSGTMGAIVGIFAVDKLGRRLLVIGSLLLLATVNTSMMLLVYFFNSSKHLWIGWGFLILFIMFLFMFSAGIGPTAWFLGAELAPAGARAQLQSLSVAAQYISCFLSPIVYYPLNSLVGPLSFLVFIVPLSLSAVYFYQYLPETKGRTTEEITRLLSGRIDSK